MAKVVMFGATGMVGVPAARKVAADGHELTAVTRDPESARAKLPDGINIVQGDVAAADGLRAVLADAEAVVIVMPLSVETEGEFNAERDGTRNILAALPSDRHARIIKLSEIGAGSDSSFRDLEMKAEAERAIEASGNPFVILRPTWFMEAWVGQLRAGPDFLAIGKGERAIHWVALEDMACWISKAIDSPEVVGRILTVQGADAITIPDAATRLAAATGANAIPVPVEGVCPPGVPESFTQTLGELFGYYDNRPEPFEADELWRSLGQPTVRFADFEERLRSL